MDIKLWQSKLKKLSNNIELDPHFVLRSTQRGIQPEEVFQHLKNPRNLKEVIKRPEGYRLVFKISSKFQLVVGIEILGKSLYIKTAFRRNRKWPVKKPRI